MPLPYIDACTCPADTRVQLLALLNTNLVTLFSAMSDSFVGTRVDASDCRCSELQILQAINQNIVEFGGVYVPGSGTGLTTKVTMPTDSDDPGADGEYAISGNQFAVYDSVTSKWQFIDAYEI